MVDEKMNDPKKNHLNFAVAALAVLLVLAIAGCAGSPAKVLDAKNASKISDAALHASKLLFSSMEKEAGVAEVHMKYADVEDGAATAYDIRNNQTDGWVLEQGDYGSLQGYFGQDNKSDVVCLTYMNQTKCAKTGTDENLLQVATRLKTRLPSPKTSLANLQFAEKLTAAGAAVFQDAVENVTLNGFETEKLAYTLDYRNLTVQQLISIGASPNDPSIYSISNWIVWNWIDRKSGLLVKSSTSYVQKGVPHSFSREFSVLATNSVVVPKSAESLVGATAFAKFYQDSEADYTAKMKCLASPKAERGACLKNIAVGNGDAGTCDLIENAKEHGLCMMVVAQTTKNAELCVKAGVYADDCYIAVVGETGDAELCKKLQNQSLLQNCYEAKLSGERIAAQQKEAADRIAAGRNCQNDSGCHIAGNMKQYCAPTTNNGPFANASDQAYAACLKGVPCGCDDGYCAFRKQDNENYTKCISAIETKWTENFIKKLAGEAEARKAAANKTNGTAGISTGANNTTKSIG